MDKKTAINASLRRSAIALLRTWREEQQLEPLNRQEEEESALKYLAQKGYLLPDKISDNDEILYLNNGEYKHITMELVKKPEVEFPLWNPQDKQEFWCEKLGFFVRLTGDLDINGFYRVTKIGEGNFRPYQVRGHELVPANQAPSNVTPPTDLLLVNSASWADIKNHLCDRFIPSFPWSKQGEKTAAQVRSDMETLAKSRHKGLAKIIEEERLSSRGSYEDAQNFTMRLNALHDSFPWAELAQTLDFAP